jgi:hypothetical protein
MLMMAFDIACTAVPEIEKRMENVFFLQNNNVTLDILLYKTLSTQYYNIIRSGKVGLYH